MRKISVHASFSLSVVHDAFAGLVDGKYTASILTVLDMYRESVSYTHLDVYKRQGMEDMKDFQNRISILEWDLKDLPALCRG